MLTTHISTGDTKSIPTPAPAEQPRFAVLGAGHGGQAMAGHLALMGFSVNLYNRTPERIEAIKLKGSIDLSGQVVGTGQLNLVTSDIAEAVTGVDMVMVVVPATGHADLAHACAPLLRDGQMVVLHPGRTGGALSFHNILAKHGNGVDVLVAEASTLIYACRIQNPAKVHIYGIKNAIPLATIPSYRTPELLKKLRLAYPQFVPGNNVLSTSLNNIGAIFHPALTILNAGRIESTHGAFEFYMDGATPSVTRVLDALDAERVAVAAALGIRATPAREWLYIAYDAPGRSLYEAMHANEGYRGISAPSTPLTRYITEDVPMSLVPIASLGRQLGVPTPTMESIIGLANIMHETDYWAVGRTVETMGLAGMSVQQIRRFALEGVPDTNG